MIIFTVNINKTLHIWENEKRFLFINCFFFKGRNVAVSKNSYIYPKKCFVIALYTRTPAINYFRHQVVFIENKFHQINHFCRHIFSNNLLYHHSHILHKQCLCFPSILMRLWYFAYNLWILLMSDCICREFRIIITLPFW